MMIVIDLPPQIEQTIHQQAQAQGISVKNLVEKTLSQAFTTTQHRQETAFDYDINEIQSAIDSGFIEVPKGVSKDLDSFTNWVKASLV